MSLNMEGFFVDGIPKLNSAHLSRPQTVFLQMTQDIGLYKIDRDVKFRPNVLQPICLPTTFDKSDVAKNGQENMVYISGWGRLWGGKCITTELGPQGRLSAILAKKKINISAAHQEPQALKTKTAKVSGSKIRISTQKLQEM